MKIDYAEALRLIRKYRLSPKEPIGAMFLRLAKALEAVEAKKQR